MVGLPEACDTPETVRVPAFPLQGPDDYDYDDKFLVREDEDEDGDGEPRGQVACPCYLMLRRGSCPVRPGDNRGRSFMHSERGD